MKANNLPRTVQDHLLSSMRPQSQDRQSECGPNPVPIFLLMIATFDASMRPKISGRFYPDSANKNLDDRSPSLSSSRGLRKAAKWDDQGTGEELFWINDEIPQREALSDGFKDQHILETKIVLHVGRRKMKPRAGVSLKEGLVFKDVQN